MTDSRPLLVREGSGDLGLKRERILYVHIGFPKTGTSTLQQHLFAAHDQIEFLGKRRYLGISRYRDIHVRQIVRQLVGPISRSPDLGLCRRLADEHVWPAADQGRRVVLSKEGLATRSRSDRMRWARNLQAVFGACRVLVTIRHPLGLILSQYSHLLKRWNLSLQARWKRPRFIEFAEWVEHLSDPDRIRTALGCVETLDVYGEVFGRDALGVFLFEQLQEDPMGYAKGICRFLGVDPDEGAELLMGRRENVGLRRSHIERLRRICGSTSRSWLFRMIPTRMRHRALRLGRESDPADGLPLVVPEAVRIRIEQALREEHRRLRDEWGLPVERYGYFT